MSAVKWLRRLTVGTSLLKGGKISLVCRLAKILGKLLFYFFTGEGKVVIVCALKMCWGMDLGFHSLYFGNA
jgi:hypothetical protein